MHVVYSTVFHFTATKLIWDDFNNLYGVTVSLTVFPKMEMQWYAVTRQKPGLYANHAYMHHWYFCQAGMHIEARLLRATRVDLPLMTTGMAAVLLCTVHCACTLYLPDLRLHRSEASTRDRLICIWPVWFSGFYPRCACMQTRLLSATLRYFMEYEYYCCSTLFCVRCVYVMLVHARVAVVWKAVFILSSSCLCLEFVMSSSVSSLCQ